MDGSANGERCIFEYASLDLISNARLFPRVLFNYQLE